MVRPMSSKAFKTKKLLDIDREKSSINKNYIKEYDKNVRIINKIEANRAPLSKEVFYDKYHNDLKKMHEDQYKNREVIDDNPVRILKENKRETIDCYHGNSMFFKIYCAGKNFPLTFKTSI